MRIETSVLAIVVAVGAFFPTCLLAQKGIDAMKLDRDVRLAELDKPLKTLNEKYEAGLNDLKARAQAKGDLDQALAITEELKKYTVAGRKTSELHPDLAKLQEIYDRESKRLIAERHQPRIAIVAKYEESLKGIESQLTQQGKLEEAVAVRKEREAAGKLLKELSRAKALAEGIILVEEFDEPLDSEAWKWTQDLQFENGFCISRSYDGQTNLELTRKISGDFRIEIDFVREGEHVWQYWSCSVKLTAIPPVAAFRLARDDINLVYVDPSADEIGKPGPPHDPGTIKVTQRGRNTRNCTLVVTHQDGGFSAAFVDSKGKKIETEPVKAAAFEETGVVIRFAGTADTPRKIGRISITRPEG